MGKDYNNKLITPDKLKRGSAIGIVSPSAGFAPFVMHRIKKASRALKKLGFRVVISDHALENKNYVSATVKERVEDIHSMFADPKIKVIMAMIGGNHSNQLLPFLDYELIRKNPKAFVGYSDITVLHFALQKKSGLQTYYGPMFLTQMAENPKPLDYSLKYFKKVLMSRKARIDVQPSSQWTDEVLDWFKKKDLKRPRKLKKNKGFEWLKKGKAEGFAWGGAIVSLSHLAGTEYWIDPEGAIAFFDIPESHDLYKGLSISDIDAYFADYKNLGIFNKINGLIIGRPYCHSEEEINQLKQLVLHYTEDCKYPVLLNANIGHADPIITIPYRAKVFLNSRKDSFVLYN